MEEPTNSNDLNIIASANSSPDDFDFLIGKWKIHNRKLQTRLNNCKEWFEFEAFGDCRKILNGFGNSDTFKTEVEGTYFLVHDVPDLERRFKGKPDVLKLSPTKHSQPRG